MSAKKNRKQHQPRTNTMLAPWRERESLHHFVSKAASTTTQIDGRVRRLAKRKQAETAITETTGAALFDSSSYYHKDTTESSIP